MILLIYDIHAHYSYTLTEYSVLPVSVLHIQYMMASSVHFLCDCDCTSSALPACVSASAHVYEYCIFYLVCLRVRVRRALSLASEQSAARDRRLFPYSCACAFSFRPQHSFTVMYRYRASCSCSCSCFRVVSRRITHLSSMPHRISVLVRSLPMTDACIYPHSIPVDTQRKRSARDYCTVFCVPKEEQSGAEQR